MYEDLCVQKLVCLFRLVCDYYLSYDYCFSCYNILTSLLIVCKVYHLICYNIKLHAVVPWEMYCLLVYPFIKAVSRPPCAPTQFHKAHKSHKAHLTQYIIINISLQHKHNNTWWDGVYRYIRVAKILIMLNVHKFIWTSKAYGSAKNFNVFLMWFTFLKK